MNAVQYKHKVESRRTFAIVPPSFKELEQISANHFAGNTPQKIKMSVGMTRVHPKDQYSKAEGRRQAGKKLKKMTFDFLGFTSNERLVFQFKNEEFLVILSADKSGNSVRLAYIVER